LAEHGSEEDRERLRRGADATATLPAQQIPEHAPIIAFRNILIHGYAVLDYSVVWSVVHDHLSALEKKVQSLLRAAPR
jgi:uncharacterized protein with HEPN domain